MLPELEFHVTIRLPKLFRGEPVQIARLETNMPNFSQHIADLRDQVLFRDLSLKSSNSHISSEVWSFFRFRCISLITEGAAVNKGIRC